MQPWGHKILRPSNNIPVFLSPYYATREVYAFSKRFKIKSPGRGSANCAR